MPELYYDPITKRWQPYRRVDLTRPAFLQAYDPAAYVQQIGAQVAELQRRGA